jgi:hypothetical protein
MIASLLQVLDWQPLYRLWELIVIIVKFLWELLQLLGGGG